MDRDYQNWDVILLLLLFGSVGLLVLWPSSIKALGLMMIGWGFFLCLYLLRVFAPAEEPQETTLPFHLLLNLRQRDFLQEQYNLLYATNRRLFLFMSMMALYVLGGVYASLNPNYPDAFIAFQDVAHAVLSVPLSHYDLYYQTVVGFVGLLFAIGSALWFSYTYTRIKGFGVFTVTMIVLAGVMLVYVLWNASFVMPGLSSFSVFGVGVSNYSTVMAVTGHADLPASGFIMRWVELGALPSLCFYLAAVYVFVYFVRRFLQTRTKKLFCLVSVILMIAMAVVDLFVVVQDLLPAFWFVCWVCLGSLWSLIRRRTKQKQTAY